MSLSFGFSSPGNRGTGTLLHKIGEQDICTVKHVIARIPFEELRKLVSDPLPKTMQILDFDDGKVNLTDVEVKDFLIHSFGLKHQPICNFIVVNGVMTYFAKPNNMVQVSDNLLA